MGRDRLQHVKNQLQVEAGTLPESLKNSEVAARRVYKPNEYAFSGIFEATASPVIKRVKEEFDLSRRWGNPSSAKRGGQMGQDLKAKTVGL